MLRPKLLGLLACGCCWLLLLLGLFGILCCLKRLVVDGGGLGCCPAGCMGALTVGGEWWWRCG